MASISVLSGQLSLNNPRWGNRNKSRPASLGHRHTQPRPSLRCRHIRPDRRYLRHRAACRWGRLFSNMLAASTLCVNHAVPTMPEKTVAQITCRHGPQKSPLRCRIYDCRRSPNSQIVDQFLALVGESIYELLGLAGDDAMHRARLNACLLAAVQGNPRWAPRSAPASSQRWRPATASKPRGRQRGEQGLQPWPAQMAIACSCTRHRQGRGAAVIQASHALSGAAK